MTSQQAASDMAEAMRALQEAGLNNGTSGNISVRTGDGMLITPTGIASDKLRPDMMVPMRFDGQWDHALRPSSEWSMHAAIYEAYPQAAAVVHAHPDHCVALSSLRRPLPAFHYMIASFGGDDVPCSAYEPFGSPELGAAAVVALKGRNACLLANHGMICHGADLASATARAVKLETLARQYFLACSIGSPVLLGADEMGAVKVRYRTYGQQDGAALRQVGATSA